MAKPRWFYRLSNRCLSNQCDLLKVDGGYKVSCPDEVVKEEMSGYIQNSLGKSVSEIDSSNLFIADSYRAYLKAQDLISKEDMYDLYTNGTLIIDISEALKDFSPDEIAESCIEYLNDIWGDPDVNFEFGDVEFHYELKGSKLIIFL